MRRKRTKPDELPTIWRVPDDLWQKIKPLVDQYDPPKPTGCRWIDARSALNAILFRLRSGCQWNQLPQEFPDESSVHRTFQRWIRQGLFDHLWAALLYDCAELGA